MHDTVGYQIFTTFETGGIQFSNQNIEIGNFTIRVQHHEGSLDTSVCDDRIMANLNDFTTCSIYGSITDKTGEISTSSDETIGWKSAIENNLAAVFDDEDFYYLNTFDGSGYLKHFPYTLTRDEYWE